MKDRLITAGFALVVVVAIWAALLMGVIGLAMVLGWRAP